MSSATVASFVEEEPFEIQENLVEKVTSKRVPIWQRLLVNRSTPVVATSTTTSIPEIVTATTTPQLLTTKASVRVVTTRVYESGEVDIIEDPASGFIVDELSMGKSSPRFGGNIDGDNGFGFIEEEPETTERGISDMVQEELTQEGVDR